MDSDAYIQAILANLAAFESDKVNEPQWREHALALAQQYNDAHTDFVLVSRAQLEEVITKAERLRKDFQALQQQSEEMREEIRALIALLGGSNGRT